MRSTTRLCSGLFALVMVSGACGDDDGGGGGGDADAAPDDTDAAPPPTHASQTNFFNLRYQEFAELGQAPLITNIFQAKEDQVAPVYQQAPGSPFGCTAWEYTAAEYTDPGIDQGTMEITLSEGPEIPPCNFIPGFGYACVGAMGTGGDITEVDVGVFAITDTSVTFGDDEVGRYVMIQGATNESNNGMFPVVMAMNDDTIIFANETPGAAEELGTDGQYMTLSGFGPAGTTFDIPNDAQVTYDFTAIAEGPTEDFSMPLDIGDAFTLDDDTVPLLSNIPMDGNEFTLSCNGDGGDCGAAVASAIFIDTTDTELPPGLPPFVLPPPTAKAVQIGCVVLAGTVTVPAEASAVLAGSDATRVRVTYIRANNANIPGSGTESLLLAGHAVAGFTTIE